ncbi:MAG: hypothetical protein GY754_24030 [bacterium]|nr:hypothetical protein [bacterium]
MKKIFYFCLISMTMTATLAFSGCEAGLSSGDDSNSSSEDGDFSFSDMYSNINQLKEQINSLSGTVDTHEGEINLLTGNVQSTSDAKNIFSGMVGIGTANPTSTLHVMGNASVVTDAPNEDGMSITNTSSHAKMALSSPAGFDNMFRFLTDNTCIWKFYQASSLDSFIFQRYDKNLNIMTFDPDGNVGIGITTPKAPLDVAGGVLVESLSIRNSATGLAYNETWIGMANTLGDGKEWLHIGGIIDNSDGIRRSAYWADRHSFNGQVGIGTLTPSTTLQVVGTVTATLFAQSSDVRFKKDITPLTGSLHKLLALQGVSYNWRTDEFKDRKFSTKNDIGFIAQDVEKILPQVVNTGSDGYKAVAYGKVTALLVEAVKEMKLESDSKIVALENENKQLKKQVASLETMNKRILALEKQLNRNAGKLAYHAQ